MALRRLIPPALIVGALLAPAIGASAQVVPPILTTTTTTTTITTTTTTTIEGTEQDPTTTTSTTEATEPDDSATGSLTGGSLSISVPSTAQLSAGTPTTAGTLGAMLGAVTVNDARGGLTTTWAASVATTPFTTGGGTPSETIGVSNITYWSGPASSTSGTGTFVPGQLTSVAAVALTAPRTAFSLVGGVGDTRVTWNPTIIVTIPSSAVIGTYVGTITHSVA